MDDVGIVFIGHGAPATDCPAQWVGELMALEWRADSAASSPEIHERIADLDSKIRDWPRHPGNDPYKAGLEAVAAILKTLLPTSLFSVGYNEFCRPSIGEAVEEVIQKGATRVLVIPSMLTPGGIHSEKDIPRELEKLRGKHPAVTIEYVWPFDTKEVAALLAAHIQKALKKGS